MKQKIEWFKEVLDLEPGSRVFFPLAKLLAADGQPGEAVGVLQQGLLRHPDHVEARLLLVELLHLQHQDEELAAEIDNIGRLFSGYPGFWNAWSEKLAATPALHDAALAMRFFAAALQGQSLNWGSIIEQGLAAVLQESFAVAPRETAAAPEAPRRAKAPSAPPAEAEADPVQAAGPALDEVVFDEATVDDAALEDDESEEAFSLRTRSMAEVLAEQGDIGGALDIYQELMQTADPEERASLEARAAELSQRQGAGAGESGGEGKSQTPGGESTRLVSLLESLAQRLEARAR